MDRQNLEVESYDSYYVCSMLKTFDLSKVMFAYAIPTLYNIGIIFIKKRYKEVYIWEYPINHCVDR